MKCKQNTSPAGCSVNINNSTSGGDKQTTKVVSYSYQHFTMYRFLDYGEIEAYNSVTLIYF